MDTLQNNINRYISGLAVSVLAALILAAPSAGQQYASQDGRLLDANNRIGSFGLNSSVSTSTLAPRLNSYITGNITGGARFQGMVPYSSPYESTMPSGLNSLSNFRRDSTGSQNLNAGGISMPRYYIDSSRSITRAFGNQVVNTQQAAQRISQGPAMSFQGLSQPMSSQRFAGNNVSSLGIGTQYSAEGLATPMAVTQGSTRNFSQSPYQPLSRRLNMQEDMEESDLELEGQQPRRYNQSLRREEQAAEADMVASPSPFEQALTAYQEEQAAEQLGQQEAAAEEEPLLDEEGRPIEQAAQRRLPRHGSARGFEQSSQFDDYLRQGVALMSEGQYYRAITAFENAAIFEGPREVAELARANALFAAGEFMSSAFYLNRVFTQAPQLADSQVDMAELFGDSNVANDRLESIQSWYDASGEPMLQFVKGYVLYQMKNYQAARESLNEALEGSPDTESIQTLLRAVERAEETPAGDAN